MVILQIRSEGLQQLTSKVDSLLEEFGKGASVPSSLCYTNSEGDRRSPDEFDHMSKADSTN